MDTNNETNNTPSTQTCSDKKCCRRRCGGRCGGLIAPLVLIFLGAIFLMQKLEIIDTHLMKTWWPLILIVIGVAMLIKRSKKSD